MMAKVKEIIIPLILVGVQISTAIQGKCAISSWRALKTCSILDSKLALEFNFLSNRSGNIIMPYISKNSSWGCL